MDNEACKIFREINEYFNNEIVDVTKFDSNKSSFEYYRPYNKQTKKYRDCENNYERINVLGTYLYKKLNKIKSDAKARENNDNQYVEYMLIWLSNILLQITKDHTSILEDSYKAYLDKHTGNFKYWNILGNKKYLKDSNISYMSQFYELFYQICNTINEYNTNGAGSKSLGNISTECSKTYKKIYNEINRCGPYVNLLKNLKTTYDNFRTSVISADKTNTLDAVIQKLTPEININSSSNEFGEECKKVHSKAEKNDLKDQSPNLPKVPSQPSPNDQPKGASKDKSQAASQGTQAASQGTQGTQQGASKDTPQAPPQNPGGSPTISTGTQINQSGDTTSKPQIQNSPDHTPNQQAETGTPSSTLSNGTDTLGSKQNPVDDTQKEGTTKGSGQKDTGSGSGNQKSPQIDPIKPGDPTPPNPASATSQGGPGIKQGDPSVNPGGGAGSKGSQGDSSGAQGITQPQSTLWSYFDLGPYISSIKSKGKQQLDNASNFIIMQKDKVTSAIDNTRKLYNTAVSGAQTVYDTTMSKAKAAYDASVSNAKTAYNASTSFFNGIIDDITTQLGNIGITSTHSDDTSGSGSSGKDSPTGSGQSSTPKTSNSNPKSDQKLGQNSDPSSDSNLSPPLPPPTLPPSVPSQPQPIQTQDSSQNTIPNGGSNVLQSHDSNPGTGIPPTPIKFNINTPTTDNGSTNYGTDIKMSEKPSIWCIVIKKKCNVVGIGIIVISTVIMISIMYKYLSFGSSKKSEKKNMKRVINFHDGKSKTKIIISSNDRSKHLKSVINSVDRKKYSLLNIYKLMQADPAPFINLFFLLIFFVYKRKPNYLE
ncbi:PIR protein CIR protein [Plasmodium vinckei vinckei]|uniref:PIR protein CIR protein n=1 Tax=Plasmodium vinckei vinckei TaxID=54757 RepID=A0A081IAM7_PLAVN|nr:PIR protein CIR protein [Plasmodium vinckei vinckei]KEG00735.1 hypothetical protein YYE_04566 [Plasmodium vinckei vinckei]VEV54573.1 PIR protein CIR protein [Plasmodium vinckei vinckei]